MQNSSSTDDASFIYAFNIIGEMFIAVLSIIGNALVLYLISRDKQLQTVTNYFIASLAAADLLVNMIVILKEGCMDVGPYSSFFLYDTNL